MKASHLNILNVRAGDIRLDPEYHLSDGVRIKRIINSMPYPITTVKEGTSSIFYGSRAKRVYVSKKENGIPLLTGSAILQADLSKLRLASRKYTPNLKDMKIQKGWTLISRSGSVGNAAYANGSHAHKVASEDVIRVCPNDKLMGGYLYAFLASKYGYSLLTQGTFGAVIQHIEPDFIGTIPVPQFPESFQNEVHVLIEESSDLREKAADNLKVAIEYLDKFINKTFKKTYFKTSHVKSSDIINSLQCRLDPPAIMNDGVSFMNEIKHRFDHITIGDIKGRVYRPGIFKRNYVSNGIPYIKGSEIFLVNPFRRCDKLSKTLTPFIDQMSLKEGQILVTCAGSVGDIKLITKEYEDKQSIGSQDIIRIESYDNRYTTEYIFTYLQLPFVYDYIQSMKYGSVIERIEPFHVESIPVVTPTNELSQEITKLIRQYMDCTYKAFVAEEKAITMVEQEIEKWN